MDDYSLRQNMTWAIRTEPDLGKLLESFQVGRRAGQTELRLMVHTGGPLCHLV